MAELKTKQTQAKVSAFLAGLDDEQKRADAETIVAIMREATGAEPTMWGAGGVA